MATFTYIAQTRDGRRVTGSITAPTRAYAQGELRRKDLSVLTLSEQVVRPAKRYGLFGPPRPRVKPKDIAVWTRQLSTMISAGIPLLEGLEILREQATDRGFKLVMEKIIERVRGGSDLSTALAEHPKLYSNIYVNMIKAGEASGQLDAILSRLAEYLEASEALKREIKSAMTYPVVSLFLIITITIGLLVGIVPKFITIFEQLEIKELPLPTEILMGVSNTLQTNFMAIIVVVVGIFIVFKIYVKTRFGRLHWDWVKLHLPVFGALFQKVAISRFSRTFATLIKSGVPIVGALEIVARTSGNALIENAVLRAREKVIKGETLADPLAESRLFPPMVTRMVGIGEKSGALEQLLTKISEFYDQEVKTTVAALSSLIEPLLIAFMGSLVGLIVLSIFLPILKVQEKLAKK